VSWPGCALCAKGRNVLFCKASSGKVDVVGSWSCRHLEPGVRIIDAMLCVPNTHSWQAQGQRPSPFPYLYFSPVQRLPTRTMWVHFSSPHRCINCFVNHSFLGVCAVCAKSLIHAGFSYCSKSHDSSVTVVTRLRAGRPGVRILKGIRDFSLLQNIHTYSGTQSAFDSVSVGFSPRE
jgi:hypothetical protein